MTPQSCGCCARLPAPAAVAGRLPVDSVRLRDDGGAAGSSMGTGKAVGIWTRFRVGIAGEMEAAAVDYPRASGGSSAVVTVGLARSSVGGDRTGGRLRWWRRVRRRWRKEMAGVRGAGEEAGKMLRGGRWLRSGASGSGRATENVLRRAFADFEPSLSIAVPLDGWNGGEGVDLCDEVMTESCGGCLGWREGTVGGGEEEREEIGEEEDEEKGGDGDVARHGATIVSTSLVVVGLLASGRAEAGDWPPRKTGPERRHLRRREDLLTGERDQQSAGDRWMWRKAGGGGGASGARAHEQSPIIVADKERMTFTIDLAAAKRRMDATWHWGRRAIGRTMAGVGEMMGGRVDLSNAAKSASSRVREAKRATNVTVRKYQRKLERLSQPLRASVVIGPDGRIRATTRGEQAKAWGLLLVGTMMTILIGRWVIVMARRNRWGWEEWYSDDDYRKNPRKVVRDRSLGGREVVVGDGDNLWQALRARWNGRGRSGEPGGTTAEGRRSRTASNGRVQRTMGPLDEAEDRATARSERVLFARAKRPGAVSAGTRRRGRDGNSKPPWWPSSPEAAPRLPSEKQDKWRAEAEGVLKYMLDARLAGQDFRDSDLLELRRLCRTYGVTVTIETTNTKESLFRAAVSFGLSACTSASDSLLLAPDRPSSFVAGMAYHLGIEIERAVIMVNAAVAARTRAGFMQAWALQKQGRKEEAKDEIKALAEIHKEFMPERNSPELELVARGLESRIAFPERKELFDIYVSTGGKAAAAVAAEALALSINDHVTALD